MKIAVLLTCHNRKEKTIDCLHHFYKQKGLIEWSYDIFLVDDGSIDGTKEAVLSEFPEVYVIDGDGQLFWNRGMSLAWDVARKNGEYDGIMWLNDDTMLYDNALETVERFALKFPGSNVVATIESAKEKGCITYGGFLKGVLQVSTDSIIKKCDTFNGNFVFIPKCVSDKIGYLDSFYRHSVGDFDYSRRATRSGIDNYVTPIIGSCERNPSEPKWNTGNIVQRFKKLYSPLGNNPIETFHMLNKESTLKAIITFIYIHIRVLLTFFIPKK